MNVAAKTKEEPQQDASDPLVFANERFPMGTHRGKRVSDIPLDYLVWAEARMSKLDSEFKSRLSLYLSHESLSIEAGKIREKLSKSNSSAADAPHVSFSLPDGNRVEFRLAKRVSAEELKKIIGGIEFLAALALVE